MALVLHSLQLEVQIAPVHLQAQAVTTKQRQRLLLGLRRLRRKKPRISARVASCHLLTGGPKDPEVLKILRAANLLRIVFLLSPCDLL